MSQPIYDPQLADVLASIGDSVPIGMTLDRLLYYRAISSPTRGDLLQDRPVDCVDHRIPGYDGGELLASVITRKGHDRAGPAMAAAWSWAIALPVLLPWLSGRSNMTRSV